LPPRRSSLEALRFWCCVFGKEGSAVVRDSEMMY
jgi:hypothetical protein